MGRRNSKARPFCNDPSQLEVDAATKLVTGAGDGEVQGGHATWRAPPLWGASIPGQEAFDILFPKGLDKTVKYICAIHPFMVGQDRHVVAATLRRKGRPSGRPFLSIRRGW